MSLIFIREWRGTICPIASSRPYQLALPLDKLESDSKFFIEQLKDLEIKLKESQNRINEILDNISDIRHDISLAEVVVDSK